MDSGPETIDDAEIVAHIRRQAQRVQMQSLLAAGVLMALSLLWPV